MDLQAQATQNVTERLSSKTYTVQTAVKDQAGITRELADGKEVSEVYPLGEASLFDEFFYFLQEFEILQLFPGLDPKLSERPTNINFQAVILIYLMRIVAGLRFYWHIEPLILKSQALMRLVGFNGVQVLYGTSRRGLKKPDDTQKAQDDTASDNANIRGPICADSVAAWIQAITAYALERFFNKIISILATHSFFPKSIHATLDSSEIQSTERCEGGGMVKKEKGPELRLRKGRIKKVMERVFGFKIWVVWEPTTSLPLAMRFAKINVADIKMAQEVVLQAVANLGDHATLVSLAFDRGFIDGKFMWWLHNVMKIIFYVPARTDMAVYRDALDCADLGVLQTRQKTRSEGAGKNKTQVVDRWEVRGITGLTSAGFYGEKGSGSHENASSFAPNPINAVVVVHSPFVENNPGCDTMVIMTNDAVDKPLRPYDRYDKRSDMENGLFREAKQAWFIQRPARATERAFRAHVYLTIITMALTTAFRTWLDQQSKKELAGEDTGIRRYRRQILQENANKLIVFNGGRYAILEAYELVILCGRAVAMPRGIPGTITIADILRKYEVAQE